MVGELAEAFVERAAQRADFAGVVGDGFLAPAIGDGAQQGDQRGGGGQDHALVDAAFDQARVALQRRGEKRLAGQKQHRELRRVGELGGVVFRG